MEVIRGQAVVPEPSPPPSPNLRSLSPEKKDEPPLFLHASPELRHRFAVTTVAVLLGCCFLVAGANKRCLWSPEIAVAIGKPPPPLPFVFRQLVPLHVVAGVAAAIDFSYQSYYVIFVELR
ncbi:hypothetical protein PIB30_086895 [Stylosanthes scabra]|uniref:CASP-like protein n=1 Tax=Stylosanthes scabra TaxID=79078 RepID=A0ABU6YS76_9FABA|nr:hypothetical protein [Stylosanthes scabra]